MTDPLAPDPRDEALRAMLRVRADRLPAPAAHDVLTAVREEMRAPREGTAFALVPLVTGRSRVGGMGWLAAAMVAAVLLAVVGGRSLTQPATETASPSGPGQSSSAAASMPSDASVAPGGTLSVTVSGLHRALVDGSLDGRLVLADSTVWATTTECGGDPCSRTFGLGLVGRLVVGVQGFEGPVVPGTPGPTLTSVGGTWVVVPSRGSLLLVGRMWEPIATPLPWSELQTSRLMAPADPPTVLHPVSGWLVRDATTGSGWSIVERQPAADGSVAGSPKAAFTLDAPALGIDPSAAVIAGPFLVRTGKGALPEVVARYDPAGLVSVAMPPITCENGVADDPLTCADAVAAAARADPWPSPVIAVEFAHGWYCGDGTFCPIVTGANGHVIIRHEDASQDLVVDVRAATGGGTEVVDSGPPAATSPGSPSTTGKALTGFVSLVTVRAAIADGRLDGSLVVLPATLRADVIFCVAQSPGPCPKLYSFAALPGVTVHAAAGMTSDGGDGDWVIVPSGGAVTVLGQILGSASHPLGVAFLLDSRSVSPGDFLLPIAGWLVPQTPRRCPVGASCPRTASLFASYPTTAGPANPSIEVTIGAPVVGYDPSVTSHGTFLLRAPAPKSGAGYTVAAGYDAVTLVRAVTAPVRCEAAPTAGAESGPSLTCAAAVDAALGGLTDSQVANLEKIDVDRGWYCPQGASCGRGPGTDAHVIVYEAGYGADVVTNVRLTGDGTVVVINMGPLLPVVP